MTPEAKTKELHDVLKLFSKFLDEACDAKATYDTLFFVLLSYIFGEFNARQVSPTDQLKLLKTVGARYWEVASTTQDHTTSIN